MSETNRHGVYVGEDYDPLPPHTHNPSCSHNQPAPVGRDDWTEADEMRERGEDPVNHAACPHGGLLLTEDPDIFDCPEGCGGDYEPTA